MGRRLKMGEGEGAQTRVETNIFSLEMYKNNYLALATSNFFVFSTFSPGN